MSDRKKWPARKYTPLGERIVVRRRRPDEKTSGGLHIPDSAQSAHLTGVVVAVAESVKGVDIGDCVVWGNMMSAKLPAIPGMEEHIILKFPEEVLAVFHDYEAVESDEDYAARKANVEADASAKSSIESERAALVRAGWGDE